MTTTLADLNPARNGDEFQLVKQIEDDVWLAERLSDRERFLSRRLAELELGATDLEDRSDAEGLVKLLSECGIDRALTRLLNHENILSLAGVITADESVWLVWDFPDAGTLSQLFHDRELAAAYTGKRYMPESLVWHVLRSVLSALAYLHEGSRLFVDEDNPVETWRRRVDDDWHPVLHGAVTAENIFFQYPRGMEEYGVCKLGNFSGAYVSGKVEDGLTTTDSPETGIVAGLKDGQIGSLDEIRKNLYTTVNAKANVRSPLRLPPGGSSVAGGLTCSLMPTDAQDLHHQRRALEPGRRSLPDDGRRSAAVPRRLRDLQLRVHPPPGLLRAPPGLRALRCRLRLRLGRLSAHA
ncbi:hypothetical protein VUR80DRAFT_7049 [Thermomyces stellatus]